MRTRVIVILLVVGACLSGCESEQHFFDVTGELYVLSAADHYDEALERAREWRPDAYLSSVMALTGASENGVDQPFLMYQFHSASTGDSFCSVEFDGESWSSRVTEQSLSAVRPSPIGRDDWSLDSIDVWSIALANGGEDFLLHHQDPTTSMAVELDYWRASMGIGRLSWRVDFFIVHGPSLDIFIDPQTGQIVESREGSMSGTLVASQRHPVRTVQPA